MKIKKSTNRYILLALVLVGGFVLGIVVSWRAIGASPDSIPERFGQAVYWNAYSQVYPAPKLPESVISDLLWETYESLQKNYINGGELDNDKLLYGAIRGMVSAAGDPYTSFFTPSEAKQFLEDAGGYFEGIGAEIGIRDNFLTVISPLAGSPAEQAGLLSEDIISSIDGEEAFDMTLEEAVSKIRGLSGTIVTLTIARDGLDEFIDIDIERSLIDIPALDFSILDNGIAVVELYSFSGDSPIKFKALVDDILLSDAKGIVIDLRNNPGGFLDASVEIAGLFLSDGDVVVIERQRDTEDLVFDTKSDGPLLNVPVIVLVNGGSASAAEILAGALRDQRGTLLVGETTFGKGTVQEFPRLTGGAALKVTVGEWLTPNEVSLRDGGLVPDIVVSDNADTPEDEVLERAMEELLDASLAGEE